MLELIIKNLDFSYPNKQILTNLSFSLKCGEILHIRGGNGCGKSTLVSLIAGLLSPINGEIYVCNNNEPDHPKFYLEYLPAEANGLYYNLDAISNLKFWNSLRNISNTETKLSKLLSKWGIENHYLQNLLPISKFSTGMKRRLALARLSLSKSTFWLLDEPLYGLDTKGVELFIDLLKSHLNNNGAVIIVSHESQCLEELNCKVLDL